jgi:hypothetical protein
MRPVPEKSPQPPFAKESKGGFAVGGVAGEDLATGPTKSYIMILNTLTGSR